MAHRAKHRRENWIPARAAAADERIVKELERQETARKEREAARG